MPSDQSSAATSPPGSGRTAFTESYLGDEKVAVQLADAAAEVGAVLPESAETGSCITTAVP